MPTAWKKAKLGARRLASALGDRAKRGVGDSPLVVQAGFPTSVADLVVKNRGRLKKTPRWLWRPHSPEGAETGCSAMAVPASQIVAAVTSTDAGRPQNSPSGPVESEQEQEQEGRLPAAPRAKPWRDAVSEVEGLQSASFHTSTSSEARSPEGKAPPESEIPQSFPRFKAPKCEVGQTFPRSKKPTSEDPGSSPREVSGKSLEEVNRRKPMMMAKVVFLVFVLVIGTKKVALGVSISAFATLFLESIGRRLLRFLKPCGESKKKWSSTVAARLSVSDLFRPPDGSSSKRDGWASIKNADGICNPNPGSSQSSMSSDSKIPVGLTAPVVQTPAWASHVEAEGSRKDQKACPGNRDANKLLRKFVPKKLSRAKGGKGGKLEGKPDPSSYSSSKGALSARGGGDGPLAAAEEDVGGLDDGNGDGEGGGEVHGFKIPAYDRSVGLEDAAFREEKVDEPTNGSAGHLVFFLIVLSGLVGGRVVATVLTVLCYFLVSSTRGLWGSQKMHQK